MLGCDIVEISRIKHLYDQEHSTFLERCFTKHEQSYFDKYSLPYPVVAGHFAAKEAVSKALGCGLGKDLDFLDFEVQHNQKGQPFIQWHKQSPWVKETLSNKKLYLSISHEKKFAIAVANIQSE